MLSIAPVNAATASHYYEVDDYYAKTGGEQPGSQWIGKGAEALGLSGAVDKTTFVALLEGKLPGGQQLGRMRDGKVEHRAGMDLTFSAPKSVSILAEVAEDKRLFAAHEKAVKAALAYLEKNAIQTRVQEKGQGVQVQNTESLVAALFQHDTSRNQDPQLHTHCVVMNMTQTPDGQWRSLSNEQIYESKMTVGMVYRAELAHEIKQLGYAIERQDKNGLFEIKGVPVSLMETFSSRRKEIEAAIARFDLKGAEGAAKATLNTRKSKKNLERDALKPAWQAIAKEQGINLGKLIPTQTRKPQKSKLSEKEIAKTCVLSACQQLTERESAFNRHDLIRAAMHYGLGRTTTEPIEQAIASLQKRGILTAVEQPKISQGIRYTTKEQVLRETEVQLLMKAGRGGVAPLTASPTPTVGLNPTQQKAVNMILTTSDRIVGIQGTAGTGKTHLLNSVREALEKEGHILIGTSPKADAAQELQKNTSIPSQTLDSFLIQAHTELPKLKAQQNKTAQTVVVVDEASMISTKKMLSLLRLAKAHDLRIVLVGDTAQLPSIEAGKSFYQLQKGGMQTVVMNDILRQKNETLKAAVYDSFSHKIEAAFAKIGDKVIEAPATELHQSIAQHWLKLSPTERAKTAIIVPDNAGREKTNPLIREGLAKEGVLSGEPLNTKILSSRGLTQEQKAHVQHYQIGDVVLFNKSYKAIGLQKGEYYTVTAIDPSQNKITLQDKASKTLDWQPHRVAARRAGIVEVYTQKNRDLQVGDKIRWTKNQKGEGRINSQTAEVVKLQENEATVKLSDGEQRTWDMNKPQNQHWEYAYASTAYAIQGATFDRVLAILDSQQSLLTNPMTFYVEISRARHEVFLYVDDKAKGIEQLQKITGEKSSALNITPETQPLKLPTPQNAIPIEAKLNQVWSRIYEPKVDALWERAKSLVGLGKPIETWKTREVSVPWYVGEGMKELGSQALTSTTQKTPEHKTHFAQKDFELTI